MCNKLPTQHIDTSFYYVVSKFLLFRRLIYVLLGLSQISKMELFVKTVNSLKPLNVFTKSSILDI